VIPFYYVIDERGIVWEDQMTYQNAIEYADARAVACAGVEFSVHRHADDRQVHSAYREIVLL